MVGLSLIILVTVLLFSLVDFLPRLLMKNKPATRLVRPTKRNQDYVILPTVYGDPSYIDKFSVSFLKRHARHVRIVTTSHETPEFYARLAALCAQTGARYQKVNMLRSDGSRIPTNAYSLYRRYFSTYAQRGLKSDTVCILIDADTYTNQSVRALVQTFHEQALDMASLRCEIAKPRTTIEHLQAFEYRLAMDNRRIDRWMTSGACNMARAEVYKKVFAKHSDFFAGGDIEIGKIAQVSGYKIRHIDFTFLTLAPDTFKDWFKQRIIWNAGGIRHHVINLGSFSWHHFFVTFYSSLGVYLLFPLRWIEMVNYPSTLPIMIAVSYVYVYLFLARRTWHPRLLLLPAYSFVQSMIIIPLAFKRYLSYARRQKSLGLLNFDTGHYSFTQRSSFVALNVATSAVIIAAALFFTVSRIKYWY